MVTMEQQTPTAEDRIITTLRSKEKSMGLGVVGFSEYLGILPSVWVRVRDNKRPLNSQVAAAAGNRFPELESYVLIFLRHELPMRKNRLRMRKPA